jgi:hypothetical protein
MDGRLNDLALNTAAVFCTTLIAFSWWHVSVLGVGLHAYGFQHGVLEKLWLFYCVEWLVAAAGLGLWFADRRRRNLHRDPPTAPVAPAAPDASAAGLAAS